MTPDCQPPRRGLPARALAAARPLAAAMLAGLAFMVATSPPVFAQDIHMVSMTGERLGDADLAKGSTIVVVWATWSPRSHDIVERVQPLAGRWSSRARFVTVDFEEERRDFYFGACGFTPTPAGLIALR